MLRPLHLVFLFAAFALLAFANAGDEKAGATSEIEASPGTSDLETDASAWGGWGYGRPWRYGGWGGYGGYQGYPYGYGRGYGYGSGYGYPWGGSYGGWGGRGWGGRGWGGYYG